MKRRNKNKEAAVTEPGTEVKTARPKKKRKKAPVIIAALVVAVIIIRAVACSSGDSAGAVVTTTNAVRGDLQESISTNGTVRSEEVSVIFAPVSGILDSVNVAAGDAVEAGELLATYNVARLESSMRQSELQYEKSNANYNSVMADNAQNQAKLNEATVNLDVLNQQISDTKEYIRSLQNELSESQRHTSNALAEESMNLTNSLRSRSGELEDLQTDLRALQTELEEIRSAQKSAASEAAAGTPGASDGTSGAPEAGQDASGASDGTSGASEAGQDASGASDGTSGISEDGQNTSEAAGQTGSEGTGAGQDASGVPGTPQDTVDTSQLEAQIAELQSKIEEKEKEIAEINEAITHNGYAASTANNSDYVAELQQKIADAQEQLQHYETYKSEMQGQKSSTENTVLDSYDKTSYSADKEIASITYQETEEDYNQAKDGICAEYAGIITECTAVSGSGVSSGAHLMTLESSENVKVTFSASKYDLEKLEIGQKVDVTISGNVYEGEISKINRMAEANASNTPMVGVDVHLLAPDDNIILGMDAKLTVYTKKAENTLMVPVEAINADKDGDFLYVVEDGVVVKKPIVCGISTDTYTEVLEGITEEDAIIVTSYTTLEEGMPVTVLPAQ